jgi:uncharacterized membrane protein YdbT with pleckstrin-like domain
MSKRNQASKPFPGQHDSEEVELVFRRHISVIRMQLVLSLVIVLVTSIPTILWPLQSWSLWFWLVGIAVAAIYFFYYWIGWYYSVYIITNERIIEIRQKGLFNRRVSEFGLDKVQNINYHIQGIEAVILRFGDITVQTYVGDLVMRSIHHPVKVHEQLVAVVRKFNAEFDRRPAASQQSQQNDSEMVQ